MTKELSFLQLSVNQSMESPSQFAWKLYLLCDLQPDYEQLQAIFSAILQLHISEFLKYSFQAVLSTHNICKKVLYSTFNLYQFQQIEVKTIEEGIPPLSTSKYYVSKDTSVFVYFNWVIVDIQRLTDKIVLVGMASLPANRTWDVFIWDM